MPIREVQEITDDLTKSDALPDSRKAIEFIFIYNILVFFQQHLYSLYRLDIPGIL
jgi:hypothetical protein